METLPGGGQAEAEDLTMRAIRDAMNLVDAEGTVGAPVDCYEPDELAGFVTQVLERSGLLPVQNAMSSG